MLEAKNISKQFPGTLALDDVTVNFDAGKVHALVGKNGSGKSTLANIFAGALQQTSGEILLDGQEMHFDSPLDAQRHGIATVFQENSLVPGLTVAENIYIGRLPSGKGGKINWKKTYQMAEELLTELGIDISAKEQVLHLNVWQQQMVEIAKAMSFEPQVLQLDEPTAPLAQHEVQTLFRIVRNMRDKGVTIIFISHKLHELWEISDTCTVLRDGKLIGTRELKDLTHPELIRMMFGDVEIKKIPDDLSFEEEEVLRVEGLSDGRKLKNATFTLHKGEILGIAGMLGSGRTELLNCIFGSAKETAGTVHVYGKEVKNRNPYLMNKMGVAMTQEDRKRHGLNLRASIAQNLCYASLYRLKKGISVDLEGEKACVERQVENLDIKVANVKDGISSLSGGNQQKVVVGNWLNIKPQILLMDEPSRGIDVNAKQQIFQIIWDEARQGIATLVVSTELEELIEICHRLLIMYNGEIVDSVMAKDVDIETLYGLCMGGGLQHEEK